MNTLAREQNSCSLAAEVLRSWRTLQVRATGLSMLPSLWPGDLLTIQSHSFERTEPGDVVLYIRERRFFIHRVVSKPNPGQAPSLITRGDCMPEPDPPVFAGELLGRVTQVRRGESLFVPARRLSLSRRFLAWVLCHSRFCRQAVLRLRATRAGMNSQFVTATETTVP